ncbi:MAG TPA: HD domain-containing protein, partial [Methanomassiliicoccales archaeon]|nr:HD domain-containing protein [Methanomassiliicoccales archaeon]
INAPPERLVRNFYTALFHDLPEVLTKDIITPVKRSVGGLEELISDYEQQQVMEKLLPLLPAPWRRDFEQLLVDPFRTRANDNEGGWVVDGAMLKGCDNLAAFIEASSSIKYGVSSKVLRVGKQRLMEIYHNGGMVAGIDFYQLMLEMDHMEI